MVKSSDPGEGDDLTSGQRLEGRVQVYGYAEDPEQFKALFAYSPYHHVQPGTKYPPLLMLSADSDDRGNPTHTRKFAAAMQAASSAGRYPFALEGGWTAVFLEPLPGYVRWTWRVGVRYEGNGDR
jgi:hypothetical protein